jgi:primosomal protein N' (replication factor Y) (superfamily II helicase)
MRQDLQVVLPIHGKKSVFDYYSDQQCCIGDVLKVKFRNKDLLGVVIGIEKSKLPEDKLKSVSEASSILRFSQAQINFMKFAAQYNMSSFGTILKLSMPVELESIKSFDIVRDEYKSVSIDLNNEQRNAADFIRSKIRESMYSVTLIDGITGSGKTEVYATAISEVLQKSEGQVLVLLPEIMLTNQFVIRLEKLFGVQPVIWHSGVSKKLKKQYLQGIVSGNSRLILSARSGLFLPFKDLKMIVLDEEHDSSYKQEDGVIYNARDMSVACGYYLGIPVILSSATPSIETLHNVSLGRYHHVKLHSRYSGAQLPNLTIVNMAKEQLGNGRWISRQLRDKVQEYLDADRQVMLFLNRRGYAPLTLCKSCGHKEICSQCAAFLVTHKKRNKLICHYCGYTKSIPEDCPECHEKDTLIFCGPGVERILDEAKILWPNVASIVVSKDNVEGENGKEIIDDILSRKARIIIGTQVLSKGHHFPALDLVGIIDADIGLFGADLRSSERTYQLLTQVSGRAGRESVGEVVLQTYYPDNPIIRSLVSGDRDSFYDLELETRKQTMMPPFSKLVGIVISGRNETKLNEFLDSMSQKIKYSRDFIVLGPVQAPISYLKGRYRYRFLVKGINARPQQYVSRWLESLKVPTSIRIKVDVDPYGLM